MKAIEVLTPGVPVTLSPERLALVAAGTGGRIEWRDEVVAAAQASADALATWRDRGGSVYGSTTGVGPLVRFATGSTGEDEHAAAILDHLVAGAGEALPVELVRGAWIVRLHTLARGFSGVRPIVLRRMGEFFERDVWPEVPSVGSLGASGDLVPLAHLAVAFRSFCSGTGVTLSSREALALVNGTAFLTTAAVLAVVRFRRLLGELERLTGSLVAGLGANRDFLNSELHAARGHPGQIASARRILEFAGAGPVQSGRTLQERYSLRCAPQVIGAAREVGAWCREVVQREIDGVDDNPLIPPDAGEARVWHGGNFHGQLVGFAADALNLAATKVGALAERQIALVLDPESNGGAPPFLAADPGPMAGLAGVQLTATALLAEMRLHVHPASAGAPESNLGNQDVVSLGFHAALAAWRQMERLAGLCAMEQICLREFRTLGEPSALGRDRAFFGPIRDRTREILEAPETEADGGNGFLD